MSIGKKPKALPESLFFFVGILATAILFSLSTPHSDFLSSLRDRSIDHLFSARADNIQPGLSPSAVTVITIDDESFVRMNRQWPWTRDVHAVLLEKLRPYQPAAVSFDIVFSGKSPDPTHDKMLARGLSRQSKSLLLTYFSEKNALVRPLEEISKHASVVAFGDRPYGHERVMRKTRVSAVLKDGSRLFVFGFESAFLAMGLRAADGIKVTDDRVFINYPDGRQRQLSLDARGTVWLSWRFRPNQITQIPYWKAVTGRFDPAMVKDKIVMIGMTSPIVHDIHATPLGVMPGIFVNANEALGVLNADFVTEPVPASAMAAMAVGLAVLLAFALKKRHFLLQFLIVALLETAIYWSCRLLLAKGNFLVEPFTLMATGILVYVFVLVYESLKALIEKAALERMALTDSLTGLYILRYLSLKLDAAFALGKQGREFCLAMIDVDNFKQVNDTKGHDDGSRVLAAVAGLIRQGIRSQDLAARYGGDEFTVVLFGANPDGAFHVMERIRASIELAMKESNVTISVGICSSLHPAVGSKEDLIRLADEALYRSKKTSKNLVTLV